MSDSQQRGVDKLTVLLESTWFVIRIYARIFVTSAPLSRRAKMGLGSRDSPPRIKLDGVNASTCRWRDRQNGRGVQATAAEKLHSPHSGVFHSTKTRSVLASRLDKSRA